MFKKLRRRFRRRFRRRRVLQYSNNSLVGGYQPFQTRLRIRRIIQRQRPIPLAGAVKTILTGAVPPVFAAAAGRQLITGRTDYRRLEKAAINIARQAVRRITGFGGH